MTVFTFMIHGVVYVNFVNKLIIPLKKIKEFNISNPECVRIKYKSDTASFNKEQSKLIVSWLEALHKQ